MRKQDTAGSETNEAITLMLSWNVDITIIEEETEGQRLQYLKWKPIQLSAYGIIYFSIITFAKEYIHKFKYIFN